MIFAINVLPPVKPETVKILEGAKKIRAALINTLRYEQSFAHGENLRIFQTQTQTWTRTRIPTPTVSSRSNKSVTKIFEHLTDNVIKHLHNIGIIFFILAL